jgi:hypothetical protein
MAREVWPERHPFRCIGQLTRDQANTCEPENIVVDAQIDRDELGLVRHGSLRSVLFTRAEAIRNKEIREVAP